MKKTVYGGRDIIAMNSLGRNHLWILLCVVIGLLLMVPAMAGAAEVHFSIPEGEYDLPQTVVLTCDEGWKVCYTTDGSSPKMETKSKINKYTPNFVGDDNPVIISIDRSTTITAVAYQEADKMYYFSTIYSQTYQIAGTGAIVGDLYFSREGGNYERAQEITIFAPNGWNICYTTDGSDPVKSQMVNNLGFLVPNGSGKTNPVSFSIPNNCTVKAVAYQKIHSNTCIRYKFSSVVSQTYTIGKTPVQDGTVDFQPEGGNYTEPQEITLTATDGWNICYTTDGSDPTIINKYNKQLQATEYSGPFTISEPTVLRAVAYKKTGTGHDAQYTFGDIAEQTYYFSPESVLDGSILFSPGGGFFDDKQEVALSCLPGWNICYTTDGSDPTTIENGILKAHRYAIPIRFRKSAVIRAVAYQRTGTGDDIQYTFGDIGTQEYILYQPDYTLSLNVPSFNTEFTNYNQPAPQPLTISSVGDSDATIISVSLSGPNADCFTLDGPDSVTITAGSTDDTTYTIQPAADLPAGIYTATVTITYNNGLTASADVSFTVNAWDAAAAPVITPAAGAYDMVQQVEISCSTEDALIYYTTDGTEPDSTVSTLYTGPIPVSSDTTIKAIAIKPGLRRSLISEAAYTFNLTLFHGPNTVVLGAEYQPVSFAYTPEKDGAYRFFCEDGEISPSITVWDGDDQIGYQTAEYQPNNRIAILTGRKEYTVRIESLHGTGDVTLMVYPSALYPIYAEPSAHGTVTVSQGALPADDGNTIGMAYAGADVYFEASPDDGYGLADVSVVNAIGKVISRDLHTIMLWGNVTVRANFDTVHSLSWEQDEHAHFDTIWINGGGMGAWGEDRVVVKGQKVQLSWECDEGFVADTFTVTTASGAALDWTFGLDNDNHQVIEFTMPGEDVHVSLTSRGFSFDSADLVLPADTKTVEHNAFEGDAQLTSVVIPAGCESIADMAFKNCANLRYIRIPEGCAVGRNTFYGCRHVYIYGKVNSPAWEYCQAHDNCEFVDEAAATN